MVQVCCRAELEDSDGRFQIEDWWELFPSGQRCNPGPLKCGQPPAQAPSSKWREKPIWLHPSDLIGDCDAVAGCERRLHAAAKLAGSKGANRRSDGEHEAGC